MLIVTDLWTRKHVVQVCELVRFDMAMARVQFKNVYTPELKANGREGGPIIYHEVMLKVELRYDGRLHPMTEMLQRKLAESQRLFHWKKRGTCSG